jgi:acyl-CoA reductase-like NAD-dependent aldehyde dehydrogenase
MELSGCDAVFVLPGAESSVPSAALAFGLRLNGSATCMAPRRLFLVGDHPGVVPALLDPAQESSSRPAASPHPGQLADLLEDARRLGGSC